MNSVDIVILVVVFLSTLIGLSRGFTREILGLFTWVGAIVAAYLTIPLFSGFTRQFVTNPMMSDLITGIVLFIIYLIILSIFTSLVSNSVHNSILGGVDRSLGFAFGFIRGVALILVAEVIFSLFIPRAQQGQTFQSSYFAPSVRRGGDTLFRSLPTSWQQYIISQIAKGTEKAKVLEPGYQQPTPQFPGQGVPQQTTPYPSQAPIQPPYQAPTGQRAPQQQTTPYPNQTPGQPSSPGQANQGVPQQTPPYPNQATPQTYPQIPSEEVPQQLTPTPTNQTVEDIEKTAESLANLKPQSVPMKNRDGQYDNRQRREMERLFQTTE
jgi:membrane protein required for colicin V production